MKFLMFEEDFINLKDVKRIFFTLDIIRIEFYTCEVDWEIPLDQNKARNFEDIFKEFLFDDDCIYIDFAYFKASAESF